MYWQFNVTHNWKGLKQYCIKSCLVLYIFILYRKICMCEKTFFFTVWPFLFFTSTPGIFSKERRLTRIMQQKKIQWWSFWSNYHRNQNFPVIPTIIRIIEITSSSRDSDSGKVLCAHLLLFKSVSFYEERIYLLHDTDHVTVFSTFSLIYQPKIKTKTCQFGAI